jgi:lipopolysaccharide export system protein LptC
MRDSAGSFAGHAKADTERLFRAARRHSRFVRFLRGAIPISLLLILAGIGGIAFFNPFRALAKLPIDPSRLGVAGTKITMEAPRLGGFTRDGRPYELTARAAAQDITNPGVLELKDIHARVQMQDKAVVQLKAASGVYDTKGDQLKLQTDIVLTSSSGYEAQLAAATVDVKKGKIVSDQPVAMKLPNGTLTASRLEVAENGDVIRFDNGVELNLEPQTSPAEKRAMQ